MSAVTALLTTAFTPYRYFYKDVTLLRNLINDVFTHSEEHSEHTTEFFYKFYIIGKCILMMNLEKHAHQKPPSD